MITILHIINSLGTGGSEMMLYKLVTHLPRTRYRHVVATLSEEAGLLTRFQESGVTVVQVGHSLKKWHALIREVKPDILYGWLYHSMFWAWFIKQCFARNAKLVWGIRSSLECYETLSRFSKLAFRVLARLSKSPDKILFNSHESLKQHQAMGYSATNSDVIANGFDMRAPAATLTRADLQLNPDDFVVGIVARVHPQKGYDVFLKMARAFSQEYPDARFVLVGKGTQELRLTMPEYFTQSEFTTRCRLLGERHDAREIMSLFDVAVCPSHTEAFPNVVGEVMSWAKPIIASNVGDTAVLVGQNQWLFEANDVHHALKLLSELKRMSPSERQDLGLQLRDYLSKHFSMEFISQQYDDFFHTLLGKTSCAG